MAPIPGLTHGNPGTVATWSIFERPLEHILDLVFGYAMPVDVRFAR